ncbi:MAG: polysaccharide deacetylase family protein [Opitutaceae bacterium]|nr:polysaccharide deacetylase family protein [Opitutaceae bacterium]
MFSKTDIKGLDLPPKTLCLTYDDGPSPLSAPIGRFLQERGVRATFFVVGKFAAERPAVLKELHDAGHIIGNHTYEHPDAPYYVSVQGDIRDQIIRTNTLIRNYTRNNVIYFRAPYGKWSPEVADELNADLRSSFKHVGPIHWEIPGIDCHYWRLGKSVEETVDAYVKETDKHGRGILVMHDGVADMETVAALNRTLELTRRLIPMLQDRGYRFVGLDEIADPQLKTAQADAFSLRGQNGKLLHYHAENENTLSWTGRLLGDGNEVFTLEEKRDGKIVLRSSDGRYLHVNADTDDVVRLRPECGPGALFDIIPISDGRFVIRSCNGNYLASDPEPSALLRANAPYMRQAWLITYVPVTGAYVKPQTIADRFAQAGRRLRFIRSKLLPR